MNETVTNNATVEEKATPFNIIVERPADFDACRETKITTTQELSKSINEIFASSFNDYVGCNLVVDTIPGRGLEVIPYLFFQILPEANYQTGHHAFQPSTMNEGDGNSFIKKLSRISGASSGNPKEAISISKDGKDALEEFIQYDRNRRKFPNWNECIQVKVMPNATLIALQYLDITRILSKIYGWKLADGSIMAYDIVPNKPVSDPTIKQSADWVVSIERIDTKALDRATKTLGFAVDAVSGVPMVRAVGR